MPLATYDTKTPTIDSALAASRVGGDVDLLGRLFASFLRNQAEDVARLCEACSEEDWSLALRLAHTLKGAAASIGAQPLERCAAEFEQHCSKLRKNPDDTALEILDSELQSLQRLHHQVLSELETRLCGAERTTRPPLRTTTNAPGPLLEELCRLLEQFDIAAVALWERRGGSVPAAEAMTLESALADYDFEAALAEARRLQHQYATLPAEADAGVAT